MQIDAHAPAAIDALYALHTRTLDALTGYETMLEHAEPEFRGTVQQFAALHSRQALELETILERFGAADAKGDGSLMGTVNKAAVSLRAFFDRIDSDTLRQIGQGEQNVLSAFDEVLNTAVVQSDAVHIRRMRTELSDLLDQTGALA